MVAFGSDHGLCGAYNETLAAVVKSHGEAQTRMKQRLLCVGAKLRGALLESESSHPNQGIQLSLKNAIYIGLSYGGSFGLLGVAIGAVLGVFIDQITLSGLVYGAYGIFFGVLAAIWYGGLDILKHYWLRATLSGLEGAPPQP